MRNYNSDVLISIFVLTSCYSFLVGYCSTERLPNLNEGDICKKGDDDSFDHVCRTLNKCSTVGKLRINNSKLRLCSFNNNQIPIVCCPPNNYTIINTTKVKRSNTPSAAAKTFSAIEKCHEYSQLIYTYVRNPILLLSSDEYIKIENCLEATPLIIGGEKAKPKEFPHMALLGYGKKVESNIWVCGGSLISERWILTAAHCEKFQNNYARWARLGDLNYLSNTDNAEPKDYKIVKRVKYPDYKPPSYYNDIALFKLEKDVEFSPYIRPICLNTDQSLKPSNIIASGWGRTQNNARMMSPDLLKINLDIIQCNTSYPVENLRHGIDYDSMMCAGYSEGGKDTCQGDSGGPLQIKHNSYKCMYTQIGITSFGLMCAQKNSPGVYTKVSNYISWIEQIVWPKM